MKADVVLEPVDGIIIGMIEVKAGATVGIGNFLELITLTDACKDKFARSVGLYDSGDQIPTGDELSGAPLSCRWSLL
jgi:hypothetical protein